MAGNKNPKKKKEVARAVWGPNAHKYSPTAARDSVYNIGNKSHSILNKPISDLVDLTKVGKSKVKQLVDLVEEIKADAPKDPRNVTVEEGSKGITWAVNGAIRAAEIVDPTGQLAKLGLRYNKDGKNVAIVEGAAKWKNKSIEAAKDIDGMESTPAPVEPVYTGPPDPPHPELNSNVNKHPTPEKNEPVAEQWCNEAGCITATPESTNIPE